MESMKSILDLVIGKLPLSAVIRSFNALFRYAYARHKLTMLPLDVILEIMKELDWYSLLNVRQSCNYLNDLTRTLPVWRSQYWQYVAETIYLARLEEPLESYSAADLEQWVLIRRSADLGWKRSDLKYTRKRKIDNPPVGGVFIVPGGRWLLVGDQEGSMLVYDLDASSITKTVLIPQDPEKQPIDLVAIDIHPETPGQNLTFTMAVSPRFPDEPIKVHIWRVTLVGHGSQAELTSSRLCTFEANPAAIVVRITIHGNLFARSLFRSGLTFLEVFDWQKSTSFVLCKATLFPGVKMTGLQILPENRLMGVSSGYLMIYAFDIIETTERIDLAANQHPTEPLWKIPFDGSRSSYSSLSNGFLNIFATSFVASTVGCIHSISIPHRRNDAPRLSALMSFDTLGPVRSMFALRLGKAFVQHNGGAITRLTYSWNLDAGDVRVAPASSSSVVLPDYPTTYTTERVPMLDEDTGRIVEATRTYATKQRILIVDTALYTN